MRENTVMEEITKTGSSPLLSPVIVPSLAAATVPSKTSLSAISSSDNKPLLSPPEPSRPPLTKRRSTGETIAAGSTYSDSSTRTVQTTGTVGVAESGGGLSGLVRKMSGRSGGGSKKAGGGGKLANALRMGGFKLGKGGGGGGSEEKGGQEVGVFSQDGNEGEENWEVVNEESRRGDEKQRERGISPGSSSKVNTTLTTQAPSRPISVTKSATSPPVNTNTVRSPTSSTVFSTDHFSQSTVVPQFRLQPTSPGSTSFEGDLTPRAEIPPDLTESVIRGRQGGPARGGGRGGDVNAAGTDGWTEKGTSSLGQTTIGRRTGDVLKDASPESSGRMEKLASSRSGQSQPDGSSTGVAQQRSNASLPPPTPGSPPQPDSYFPDLDTALRRVQLQAAPTGPKAIESPTGSEGTTPGGELTPWPTSKKHGGTPIGAGAGAAAAMAGSQSTDFSAGTAQDSGQLYTEVLSTPSSLSFAPIGAQSDAELVAAGTGFMVSTPLSPPPGYPTASPIARTSSRSAPASRDNTPISERGEHGPRHTSFSAFSGVTAAWKDAVEARRLSGTVGIGIDGKPISPTGSGSTGSEPSSVSGSPVSSLEQGPLDGTLPYEGKITIDTEETRYVITAELEGFKLENITIAVKSVSVSTSGAGNARTSDSASAHSIASSTSAASGVSTGQAAGVTSSSTGPSLSRSQHRARRLADDPYATHGAIGGDIGGLQDLGANVDLAARRASIASTSSSVHSQSGTGRDQSRSSQHVERRKVVHLVADRWEDSAHFERRITFGADADLSGGVKAKFDGKQLAIVVPRQPRKHSHNPLRKASTSDTTPATTSVSPNLHSPILTGHRASIASSGSDGSRSGSLSSVTGSGTNGNVTLEGVVASPEPLSEVGPGGTVDRSREETVTNDRRGEWREDMMAVGGDVHPHYARLGNGRSRTTTG